MRNLAQLLQIDRALVYAMSARAWQAVSGPITIVFLVSTLNLAEQGIYYSLTSIIGIQMFFELGLLSILVGQAGNQAAFVDQPDGQDRLSELWRAANAWFRWAAVLFAIAAIAIGWNTLCRVNTQLDWPAPLLLMVCFAAITIAYSPSQSILEGAGHRDDVYRFRLIQMVLGNVAVWSTLLLGGKIWALVAAAGVQALTAMALVQIRFASFFARLRLDSHSRRGSDVPFESGFSWMRDVMPLQWRQALLSAVYHVATQFFTLIVLWFESQEAAGQLGMTLSATGAIQAMALAWVQTKFPLAAREHGAGNREAAGTMWRRMAIISTLLLISALLAAGLVVWLLPLANVKVAQRFITPTQLLVLSVGIVANHLVAIQAYYVIARGSRQLMRALLTGFTCTAVFVWLGGYFGGTSGVILGYTLASTLITLPLHSLAYRTYRDEDQNLPDQLTRNPNTQPTTSAEKDRSWD